MRATRIAHLLAVLLGSLCSVARADTVFVDFDDTLVRTEELFARAKAEFVALAQGAGYEPLAARAKLNEVDRRVLAARGYSRSIGESMRQTMIEFGANAALANAAQEIGDRVLAARPRQFPHARASLAALRARGARLILLSKGDRATQERRLAASGLSSFFDAVEIVPDKSRATHRRLFAKYRLRPDNTWLVSNSYPADIRPAIDAGLRADRMIWVYGRKVWERDMGRPDPAHRVWGVRSLRKARRVLLDNASPREPRYPRGARTAAHR